jgi:hypothetical protein
VLQQPYGLLVNQLSNHVTQYGTDGVKALVGLADILQTHVVKQDLLDDEDSDRLAEL